MSGTIDAPKPECTSGSALPASRHEQGGDGEQSERGQRVHATARTATQYVRSLSRTQTLRSFEDVRLAHRVGRRAHRAELRVRRELRDWFRQVLVQGVRPLLPNLSVFVAVTSIKTWLFHTSSMKKILDLDAKCIKEERRGRAHGGRQKSFQQTIKSS